MSRAFSKFSASKFTKDFEERLCGFTIYNLTVMCYTNIPLTPLLSRPALTPKTGACCPYRTSCDRNRLLKGAANEGQEESRNRSAGNPPAVG